MQKWEYLFVRADFEGGVLRPHFENDVLLSDWRTRSLADYANRKGEEGWELMSVPLFDWSVAANLIFKRPKSDTTPQSASLPRTSTAGEAATDAHA